MPQLPANPSVSPVADELGITNSAPPAKPAAVPSSDEFRNQLRALGQSSKPAPATTFQKAKVVKKVRVQSPPPSSPESAGTRDKYSRAGNGNEGGYGDDDESESESSSSDDDEDTDGEIRDPFGNIHIHDSSEKLDQLPAQGEIPNSFPKGPRDFEVGWNEVKDASTPATGGSGGKGTLDVNAFGRLLLTGESGGPVSLPREGKSSAALEDSPRIFRSNSAPTEPDVNLGSSVRGARKPPPAPSSRHGKLIKVEFKPGSTSPTDQAPRISSSSPQSGARLPTSALQQRPLTPSDVNKPLPPAPLGPPHGDAESIFDREAAGKVPELDEDYDELPLPAPNPPTPPNSSHARPVPSSTPAIKPTPPPRRTPHGRSDSKLSVTSIPAASPSQLEGLEISPRRSSQESVRSRSSSLRASIHAPAPPPPRRSGHPPPPPHRGGSGGFVPPSTVSFLSVTSGINERGTGTPDALESPPVSISTEPLAFSSDETKAGSNASIPGTPGSAAEHTTSGLHPNHNFSKLPPPPPPARSISVRSKRPASVSSPDITSRRVPGTTAPPPPPPSRQRGSSKGSMDGSAAANNSNPNVRSSVDSVRILPGTLAEEPDSGLAGNHDSPGLETASSAGSGNGVPSSANDILADLTALQREVDALRGQYEKENKG